MFRGYVYWVLNCVYNKRVLLHRNIIPVDRTGTIIVIGPNDIGKEVVMDSRNIESTCEEGTVHTTSSTIHVGGMDYDT